MSDNSGPAFPIKHIIKENGFIVSEINFQGLTKREWFAGMALQGMLAKPLEGERESSFECYAECSFRYADAMLAEGEK